MMKRDEAVQLRFLLMRQAATLSDEDILEVPAFVEKWKAGVNYAVADRLNYNGTLYKVLQDHTSQEGWEPELAPSLFAQILAGQGGTEVGEWTQPDSTNPYNTGDRCLFNGVLYESVIDNNVWSPAVYPAGWKTV